MRAWRLRTTLPWSMIRSTTGSSATVGAPSRSPRSRRKLLAALAEPATDNRSPTLPWLLPNAGRSPGRVGGRAARGAAGPATGQETAAAPVARAGGGGEPRRGGRKRRRVVIDASATNRGTR